ncbi:MAG: glycoside hydrolase family 3 C-terminal domain-containing protein [Clostridia bacterium]|nr:glycoside hydrolase family 3 C-terminal domain-containing protein [Clostridia bacterium]
MKFDVKKLSLDQKLDLLTGKNRWQTNDLDGTLDSVFMADGPHGLRKEKDGKTVPASAMPNLSQIANSWDRDSAYLDGQTIANDCIENAVDVLLAPGVNIKRTPLCGRNFEYFSEDPYLTGELASCYVDGVQSKGIGTSLKHFAMNNLDFERLYQSSEADERTMREIYFAPFERVISKSKPWTVMCSYNLVNGVYSAENKWLLDDVLRKEFGHDGLIVSDWWAVKNPFRSVKATLDLEMPSNPHSKGVLKQALERGLLTEQEIDERVDKILELIEKTKNAKGLRTVNFTKEQRHQNAVNIAKEGMVLLKNDGILPLTKGNVMVLGSCVKDPVIGGGGSANAKTLYKIESLCDLLNKESTGSQFEFYDCFRVYGGLIHSGHGIESAYGKDAVVLCVSGQSEGEGGDRASIKLAPLVEDFIINLAKINSNVIVCLYAGSAIDVSAWIDKVKGVILVGYAGEGVHEALAPIITGKISPSGKLSETFPLCLEDTPSGKEKGNGYVNWYKEGMFVGYRYYDEYDKPVQFPFGHGLSYANFVYSDLSIEKTGDTDYTVSFTITNTSDVDAKEVSQIYIADVMSHVKRPKKELKGFSKDLIKAHESVRVSIKLDYRSFAFYSQPLKKWQVENGVFEVLVGASSKDIRLTGQINMNLPEITQPSTEYMDKVDVKFPPVYFNMLD